MVTINDKAGIFNGQRHLITRENADAVAPLLHLVRTRQDEVAELLNRNGFYVPEKTFAGIMSGVVKAIHQKNNSVIEGLKNIGQQNNKSNIVVDVLSAINMVGNWLGIGGQNQPTTDPNQVTNALIELQKEKEKAARTKQIIVFASLTLLFIIGVVVIVTVASSDTKFTSSSNSGGNRGSGGHGTGSGGSNSGGSNGSSSSASSSVGK